MLSADASRNFGGDSHFWLIPTGHGRVLHAGPGVNMHLLDTRGNLFLTDFGIARTTSLRTGTEFRTGEGIVVGTPEYMSPEQASGDFNLSRAKNREF